MTKQEKEEMFRKNIMSFKEKIDKILEVNTLGIHSVFALEKRIGASVGSIRKYHVQDKYPGQASIKKLLNELGISSEWWSTGIGEVFVKNTSSSESESVAREPVIEYKSAEYYRDQLIDTQKNTIDHLRQEIDRLWAHLNDLSGKTGVSNQVSGKIGASNQA
jgi:hypothetical protein